MKHICNLNIFAKFCKKIFIGAPWGAPQSIKIVTFKFIYVFCNLNRMWQIPTMRNVRLSLVYSGMVTKTPHLLTLDGGGNNLSDLGKSIIGFNWGKNC